MKPADNISKFINNASVSTNVKTDDFIQQEVLAVQEKTKKRASDVQPGVWRYIMNSKLTKFVAAAVVIIACVFVVNQFGGSVNLTSPTFAEVVKPVFEAKTIIFDLVVGEDNPEAPVMRDIVQGSVIRRTISNLPGIILIIDAENRKMLHLDANTKGAAYIDVEGPLKTGTENLVAFLRKTITDLQNNPNLAPKEHLEQELNGRPAILFDAGQGNEKIKIWADPLTSYPVQIEMRIGQQAFIMKNFEFNTPVEESWFSLEVPSGYTLAEDTLDLSNVTEEDFITSLRIWAEILLDGKFPDTFSPAEYMKQVPLLEGKFSSLQNTDEEKEQMGMQFIKGMMFIQLFEANGHSQWRYDGKGVKFGDSDAAIFSYQPAGSEKYRVIYGDLSVKDMDQLP